VPGVLEILVLHLQFRLVDVEFVDQGFHVRVQGGSAHSVAAMEYLFRAAAELTAAIGFRRAEATGGVGGCAHGDVPVAGRCFRHLDGIKVFKESESRPPRSRIS
jgi:hypothetical protein